MARRHGKPESPPLFTYTPSAKDVQEQIQQFRSLQEKVVRQRRLIRLKGENLVKVKCLQGTCTARNSSVGSRENCSGALPDIWPVTTSKTDGKKTHRPTKSDGEAVFAKINAAPKIRRRKGTSLSPGDILPPSSHSAVFLTDIPCKASTKLGI